MTVRPRPHLAALPAAVHGGLDYAELASLGLRPSDVLDFSVSVNPEPAPRELHELLASVDIGSYPDDAAVVLREAAAQRYGVLPGYVLAGNGSSELLWLVGLAYLSPRDRVLIYGPTFGEYARMAGIFGASVTLLGTAADPSDRLIPATAQVRIAFVCNPNNPTGVRVEPAVLVHAAHEHPDTLLVVDEAYADFVDGRPTAISARMADNLIVLRSLTKFSGLAGLRLGLAFGQPATVDALRAVKPPWNVNVMAQAAGAFALNHDECLPDLTGLANARAELMQGLRDAGFRLMETACNFFLMHVGDGKAFRARLLKKGILVRDCASFGLPDYVRIAVRTTADNRRLLEAVA